MEKLNQGDQNARNTLIEHNLRLVAHIIKKYYANSNTNGLLGFEKYTRYVIAYDSDKESKNGIMWLQCVDEPELAFPVMDPMFIIKDYRPVVEDEWLAQIGIFESDEELYVLSVLTVPSDLTKMTINLKAPIVINISTRLGCQIIVNNEEYPVRYSVYDCFNKK